MTNGRLHASDDPRQALTSDQLAMVEAGAQPQLRLPLLLRGRFAQHGARSPHSAQRGLIDPDKLTHIGRQWNFGHFCPHREVLCQLVLSHWFNGQFLRVRGFAQKPTEFQCSEASEHSDRR